MSRPRVLMLVSTRVTSAWRTAAAQGAVPMPEFLDLEERFGFDLLDWTQLRRAPNSRSALHSMRHVAAALSRVSRYDAVVSDGEHVGIPLAMALRARRLHIPHIVIGHHLSTRAKAPFFSLLRADHGISRILLHSHEQAAWCRELGLPRAKLQFVPYFADSSFWSPAAASELPRVIATGREHRDYATLARAIAGLPETAVVAAGSPHSPSATCAMPAQTPTNMSFVTPDYLQLRSLYRESQVVVVPLLETDFQAGVTSLLEAMAMGKSVVLSATRGQRDIVRDGVNGLLVPPADAGQMRRAIRYLLDHPAERARLGRNARHDVEATYDLRAYSNAIADQVDELTGAVESAA